jgi:phage N-6-adenine-methyltransferase
VSEPQQKPGRSKQDYGTPKPFLAAVAHRFGPIDFDLAATSDNAVADRWYAPDVDSLRADWTLTGVRVAFLNPPFADIRPWAAKLESVRHIPRWTIMLVPASMGSAWWADHILGKCQADGIPRMEFVGADGLYPKDLAVLCAGFSVAGSGYWDWRVAAKLAGSIVGGRAA